MDTRVKIVLSSAAALLAVVPAGANPIMPYALIPHYAPEIAFSTSPPEGGWAQAYNASPVTGPEDLNLRIDVEGDRGVVWYVLVAMNTSTQWCGTEFGLGPYDAAAFVPVGSGPCFPSQGLEVAGEDWPSPMTGTALVTTAVPWEGVWVPVYYFTGYVYSDPGPTVISLASNPASGFVGFSLCTTPPIEYPLMVLGSLGINADGAAVPPHAVSGVLP